MLYLAGQGTTNAMSPLKQQVIDLVQALPDDVTADDVLAEIYYKMPVDGGLAELDRGEAIPHEAVEERMARWASR